MLALRGLSMEAKPAPHVAAHAPVYEPNYILPVYSLAPVAVMATISCLQPTTFPTPCLGASMAMPRPQLSLSSAGVSGPRG